MRVPSIANVLAALSRWPPPPASVNRYGNLIILALCVPCGLSIWESCGRIPLDRQEKDFIAKEIRRRKGDLTDMIALSFEENEVMASSILTRQRAPDGKVRIYVSKDPRPCTTTWQQLKTLQKVKTLEDRIGTNRLTRLAKVSRH
jgi:hypothetical protein